MLPPVDISYIADQLVELGEEIQRAYDESTDFTDPSPQVLLGGLDQLLNRLRAAATEQPVQSAPSLRTAISAEPESLLTHGLDLLSQLAGLADRLALHAQARAVELLALPFYCWMWRRGAELLRPEPVVNAAAALANRLRDPDDLAELYVLMNEIVDGLSPEPLPGVDAPNPSQPWRILLLNRAIVATRSLQPALMEDAFSAIVEHLPEDAPDFFREGMGQMDALNYPPLVREVMQSYFDRWCTGQRLH